MNFKPCGLTGINEIKCVFWNVGLNKKNYSQRNNEFFYVNKNRKVNWTNECNVTSMVRTMDYNGFVFPTGKYAQPEDNLADFIVHSKNIDSEYAKRFPALYTSWKAGEADSYSPIEIHKLLELGVNEWIGSDVDTFSDSTPIEDIRRQIIDCNKSVVLSGNFGKLGHIVSLVGIAYEVSTYEKCYAEGSDICKLKPVGYCYDDSWGTFDSATKTYDTTKLGNDVWLTNEDFNNIMKPIGNENFKFAHIFRNPVSLT